MATLLTPGENTMLDLFAYLVPVLAICWLAVGFPS